MTATPLPASEALKVCTKCGEGKPLSAFHRHHHTRDGRNSRCIECARITTRQWRKDNQKRHRASADAWAAAHPERHREIKNTSQNRRRHLAIYGRVLETPEDIIQHAKDRYRRARAEGYRSGLEVSIARSLERRGVEFQYEPITLNYVVPARTTFYKPDIVLPNGIVVELKGRWVTEDRKKLRLIKEQHPHIDLRIVFANPQARISKTSKTTYAMVAEKIGLPWAAKDIPDAWLKEPKR